MRVEMFVVNLSKLVLFEIINNTLEASLQQDEQFPVNKDTKCILPWIHQHGDISGNYALCCFTLNKPDRSDVFFSKDESPLKAWNSDYLKSARLAMLSKKRISACSVCYNVEDNGVESHRQRVNNKFSNYSYLYSTTKPDGSLKTPPIYLDFRFGNLCNFSCRMCGSDASSSWVKESKALGYLDKDAPAFVDEWTDNNLFWRDLDTIKNSVKLVYFAGGEPLVQEGHYKFLKFMIDNNCTDIELNYNTNLSYNGSFKGNDVFEMWSKFKEVALWPSIDGFGKKAEYGRKGLNWGLFSKNANKFNSLISSYSIVNNIYSITSIPDLLLWIKKQNKSFFITNLTHPLKMSVTILDKETKKTISNQYKKFLLDNLDSFTETEVKNILDVIKYMMSSDNSNQDKIFYSYNETLDSMRKESFIEVYPELAEWYKNI